MSVLSGTTLAATPTVTFQGEITDHTCLVTINGETNSVVLLPTVAVADFGGTLADGQTAGLTPFTVSISDCAILTPFAQSVSTRFLGFDVDANSGVLGNRATSHAATGYGVQITGTSAGGNPVRLSGITDVFSLMLPVGATEASHTFGAQYYVIDAGSAAPGAITAVAEYTVSYL